MSKENKQKNIEQTVLDEIEQKHLAPKATWWFWLRYGYIWLVSVLMVFVGALAAAATLFVFRTVQWELYEATHDSFFSFLMDVVPVLWITLVVGALIATYYGIRKTKYGYKYNLLFITCTVVASSILLGIVLFHFGFGRVVDRGFGGRIPMHEGIEMSTQRFWDNPQRGLLLGVVSVDDEQGFVITDTRGAAIPLEVQHLSEEQRQLFENGSYTRVIGTTTGEVFYVCGILPQKGSPRPFERKNLSVRSKECEGILPYQRLLK